VTRILMKLETGDPSAAEQLLPVVYDELRQLAAVRLSQEKPGQTLQATALVHEAYLKLVGANEAQHWNSRGHFFGAAAEAMRRILIDQARRKKSEKAGGQHQRRDLSLVEPEIQGPQLDLIALDVALDELQLHDPRAAALVKLRFFSGLTVAQAAEALGVSIGTAENDWVYAKSWLRLQMSDSQATTGN
jgi:RNA polymerase sigma factor (TIGR02999 family)